MINCDDSLVDLYNYSNTYYRIASGYGEFKFADAGYFLLQKVVVSFGFSFLQFRMIVFGLCFCLIYSVIKRYTNNISMFVLFYSLFYSIMDGEQLRNFIAFSIIIYGLPNIIEDKKHGLVKYIICNIVAMQFHFMAISYFLLLIVKAKEGIKRTLIRVVPVYLIVMYYVARHGSIVQNLLVSVSEFGNEQVVNKMANYSITSSKLGFLLPCGLYIIEFVSIILLNTKTETVKLSLGQLLSQNKKSIDKHIYTNISIVNAIGCLFIPICMVNLTFYRLLRNITMFNLIYMSSLYSEEKKTSMKKFIVLILIILTVGWQIWDFFIYQEWDVMKAYYFHI